MKSNLFAFIFLTSSVLYAQEDQPDVGSLVHTASQEADFREPPRDYHPETWFHLIGGNVNKPGLTADLEAIHAAGISGIQLFHGSGSPWPGITPQITTLSYMTGAGRPATHCAVWIAARPSSRIRQPGCVQMPLSTSVIT